VGRAARNLNGKAIMYADKITRSMQATIDSTNYKREKQQAYNLTNNITPRQVKKSLENALSKTKNVAYTLEERINQAAESIENSYLTKPQIEKKIKETRKAMEIAAKELNFLEAAKLRDEILILQKQMN